jgi:hypothetical protein
VWQVSKSTERVVRYLAVNPQCRVVALHGQWKGTLEDFISEAQKKGREIHAEIERYLKGEK